MLAIVLLFPSDTGIEVSPLQTLAVDAGPDLQANESEVVTFLGTVTGGASDPLLNWEKEPGVRVDVGAGPDSVYAFHPHLVVIPGGYRMYYSGNDGSRWRILSAASADQVSWTKEPGIRVDVGTPYDSQYAYSSEVLRLANGTLRMYYAGFDGTNLRILSTLSIDGLNWSKEPGVRVAPGGSWDSVGALSPHVVPLPTGGLRMYYAGFDGGTYRILSATSSDGLSWTKEGGVRIDRGGPYDGAFVDSAETVILADGRVRMFYHGNDGARSRILSATSTDGLAWTKEMGIRVDIGGPSDSAGLGYPEIAATPSGGYRLFYAGLNGSRMRILSAIPEDETTDLWWDVNAGLDSDGNGVADDDRDLVGEGGTHVYGDNGVYVVKFCGRLKDVTECDPASVTVLNVSPSGEVSVASLGAGDPRTQGYWSQQCRQEIPPSREHVGIQHTFVDFISQESRVFRGIATREEVCQILDRPTEGPTARAERQLMALWLNAASGKLDRATEVNLSWTPVKTVGEAIDSIESVLLFSQERSDILLAKDLADALNNGVGIARSLVRLEARASDPGSDDLTFQWYLGDGTAEATTFYNDGVSPDPVNSPWGTLPFNAEHSVSHGYGRGVFTVTLLISDDDGGTRVLLVQISA